MFFEQQEAAFQAVDYLISRGHRDIACLTVPMHTPTGKARPAGYRSALEKARNCVGTGAGQVRRFNDDPRL